VPAAPFQSPGPDSAHIPLDNAGAADGDSRRRRAEGGTLHLCQWRPGPKDIAIRTAFSADRAAGGRHGGEGVQRVEESAALAAQLPDADAIYATEFTDYRSADGWYRKYRAIFVDHKTLSLSSGDRRSLAPSLLDGRHGGDAARRDEELRFLRDPEGAVGIAPGRRWCHRRRTGSGFRRHRFSVLADGRLLFFEANATMLVHPEDEAMFAYKNAAVREIISAMDIMIQRRLAAR